MKTKKDKIQTAIRVEGLSKTFKVPHEKHTSLKSAAIHMFNKKTYAKFEALKDVNFEVKTGEFFGIIGRNGSGKSTLLKILAGIYLSDSGQVKIHGKLSPFLELGVGFNPELTGRENLFLGGAILGLTRQEVADKFDKIVAFAELEEFIDMKLKNYSSGMQVRLAFSLAINVYAEILLMDEVLAVGDSNFQAKCLEEFKKYKKAGKTVVLVSHDITTIEEYCDRALLLDHGKIVVVGQTKKAALEYQQLNMADENKKLHDKMNVKVDKDTSPYKKGKTYGNGKATIYDVKIINAQGEETLVLESGTKFQLKLLVELHANVRDVTFNATLRDEAGNNRLVLHSLYSRNPLKISEIKKNNKIELTFSGDMILSKGKYNLFVDVCENVVGLTQYSVMFARENILNISVFSDETVLGPFNYVYKTESKKIN